MTAVLFRLRASARSRWRAWLGFALATGLVGGATIAALAGARRTETSYDRFLDRTRAFDVIIANGGTTGTNLGRQFDFEELAKRPEVLDAAELWYYFPTGALPSGRALQSNDIGTFVSPDGRFGSVLNEARLVRGRLPEGVHEIALSLVAAERLERDVGDTLSLGLTGQQRAEPPVPFTVVGIMAIQTGFPPMTGAFPPLALLAPAYAAAHPDGIPSLAVRLRDGEHGIAAFQAELRHMVGGEQVASAGQDDVTSAVQRGLSVQATALRGIGVLVAGVAIVLLAQALARQRFVEAADETVLRALGATARERRWLDALTSLGIAVAAAAVAVVVAVGLSAFTPIGTGRQAEPDPGLEVNVAHLVVGAAVMLVVVTLLGLRRPPRPSVGPSSGSRLARALTWLGAPPVPVSGVRLALEPGGGRSHAPVRSTLAGAVLGVAAIAAVLCFSASLTRLFDEPRLYGWTWDIQVGDAFSVGLDDEAERLAADPATSAVARGSADRFDIGGRTVDVLAFEPIEGDVAPAVARGRLPAAPDELILGGRTLRDLGLRVGDRVEVASGQRAQQMQVVGQGILPESAGGGRFGEGAAMTLDGMRQLVPGATADVVFVRFAPGRGGEALRDELLRHPPGAIYLPERPSDLVDLERVGGLPWLAAALLGLTALATLAHALLSAPARRARDLAVLKALGFARRQVGATIAFQAGTIATVAVVLGLPLGMAGGRWSWQRFAAWIGAPPGSVVPAGSLVVLALASLALALAMATVPAWLAARTRPAPALRADP